MNRLIEQSPVHNVAVLLVVLVLVLSVQAAKPSRGGRQDPCGSDPIKCTGTGQKPRTLLPFPENCTQYLWCTGSDLHVMDCKDGKFFDVVTLSCHTSDEGYECQTQCPTGAYLDGLVRPTNMPMSSAEGKVVITQPGHDAVTEAQRSNGSNVEHITSAASGQTTTTITTTTEGPTSTSSTAFQTNNQQTKSAAPVTSRNVVTGEAYIVSKTGRAVKVSSSNDDVALSADEGATTFDWVGCLAWDSVSEQERPRCVSLTDAGRNGWYVRHRNYYLHVDPISTTSNLSLFKADSSFIVHADTFYPDHYALESVNYRDHYIKSHGDGRLAIVRQVNSKEYNDTASFRIYHYNTCKITSSSNTSLERRRAEFNCTITLTRARVERFVWSLNALQLSADQNRRINIVTEPQPNDRGQWKSTLVFEPIHLSDSGMLTCDVDYGGAFVARSNLSIAVVPLPRVAIHPGVVTSERDVTQEITCSAVFPGVSRDVTARVMWFEAGSTKPVNDSKWMTLRPGDVSAVVRGFCPDGWHHYNGSCFYVSTANASQPEARSKCLTMNADLASISNQAEWDFVKSISVDSEDYWFGLYKKSANINSRTMWYDDNPSTYRNWSSGEPNEDVECVRYTKTGFKDRNCTLKEFHYTCKKVAGDKDNTQRNKHLEVRSMSSGIKAVSRLYVNVTDDAEYVCRWSTRAGPADNLTCIVSSITAESLVCNAEKSRDVEWSMTRAGRFDLQPCPPSFTGSARRNCLPTGVWSKPNFIDCVSEQLDSLADQLDELDNGLRPINSSIIASAVVQLKNTTGAKPTVMSAADLSATIAIMLRIARIYSIRRRSLILQQATMDDMVDVTNNMLDDVNAATWETLSETDQSGSGALPPMTSRDDVSSSEMLMWSINELSVVYAEQLRVFQNPLNRTTHNLLLQIKQSKTAKKLPEWDASPEWRSSLNDSFQLPDSPWLNHIIDESDGVIYSCSYARNLQNYLPQPKHVGGNGSFISTAIMSLDILGIPKVLKPPIIITMKHLKEVATDTQTSSCVFWNFTSGRWSSENCKVTSSNATYTSCEVRHLTNFAILVSPYTPSKDLALALSIISVIGCIISSVCLFFTIVIYIVNWKTMKSHRAVVLLNLCVALIVANIVFVAGVDKTRPTELCTVVAVLLYYFFLSAFFLMLVEGVQLCVYVFAVFHVHRKRDTAAMIFAAWFLSLVVVGATLGVTRTEGFGNDEQCWLSVETGLLWAFVVPAMIVVAVNAVIMVLVLKRISTANVRSNVKRNEVKSLIRNILVILPILGLTWVFGVVAVNSDLVAFQFIFAVCNSLQGVFIFIFHAFCRGKSSAGDKKKLSSSPWNGSGSAHHSNGNDRRPVLSDVRQQCISRRHHPYFNDLGMATGDAGDDDDNSSNGVDNPGYDNAASGPIPSPVSGALARQSELVRDIREDQGHKRRAGKNPERPVLHRFVSDMSDISNSTTSTFIPSTPGQRPELELTERL